MKTELTSNAVWDLKLEYGAELSRWPFIFHIRKRHWGDVDKIKYAINLEIYGVWVISKELTFKEMFDSVDGAVNFIKDEWLPQLINWAKQCED